jgi:serine/threonine protein kinase
MSAVGDLLAGRYELRSRLGRGGMAEVFRAVDTRLGRDVAVKVLARHLLADPRSVERFEREGRTAASLHHPNIVNVYDAASEGDTHYLVMELVEGPTLAEIIKREGQMPLPRALDIASRIAAALQVAHGRGLVHHDVKPSNVLFDRDDNVKVTDFGIARAASSDITTVQGSPPYVAPEQAKGGRADPRSDVYGLGCVLFEMLAGQPPFSGSSASAVIMQHLETPPPPLTKFRNDVPADVSNIVTRALAKDPEQRYDSAQALRSDLDLVAAGQPISDATIASTRQLDDPERTVAVGANDATVASDRTIRSDPNRVWEPPRDTTRAYTQYTPRDDEPPSRPRRQIGRPSLQALAVATVVVLLLVVGYLAFTDTRLRDRPAGDTAQDEAQAEEPQPDEPDDEAPADDTADDAPDDTADDDSSVGGAASRIRDLLERGREADEATSRAVEQLQEDLADAVERQTRGDDEGASDRIQDLRERLNELDRNREVGSDLADRLREMIDGVRPFQD